MTISRGTKISVGLVLACLPGLGIFYATRAEVTQNTSRINKLEKKQDVIEEIHIKLGIIEYKIDSLDKRIQKR